MSIIKKDVKKTISKSELVKEFTVDRRRWLRGEGDGKLRDEEGNRCCIGFYAGACGYKADKLNGVCTLDELVSEKDDNFFSIRGYDSDLIFKDYPKALRKAYESVQMGEDFFKNLYEINDDDDIRDKEREEKIKKIFKSRGIKVIFTH